MAPFAAFVQTKKRHIPKILEQAERVELGEIEGAR